MNKLSHLHLLLIALLLNPFITSEILGQDTLRIARLTKETQDLFLATSAQGILLSPYELRQHHRDQIIRNIEWVDGFDLYAQRSSKTDILSYFVKDNQTIILQPTDPRNGRTYVYKKDGRIHKTFRGNNLIDLYVYNKNGFLIQHGFGDELKKAKLKGKVFNWYTTKKKRLEYTSSFDEEDRLSKLKMMGHAFGPAVDYQIEDYLWEGSSLMAKNTIIKYKEGSTDTTFVKFIYDSLGIISSIDFREEGSSRWYSTKYEIKVESEDDQQVKIEILQAGKTVLAITFDHYDNWIAMERNNKLQSREIKYRKEKRQP